VALGQGRWQRRFLSACLSDSSRDVCDLVAGARPDWLETIPVLASFHRVVGPVLESAGDALPPRVRSALLRLQRDEQARKLIAAANLSRCDALLRGLGVPFLVVKGPVLAAMYDRPQRRSFRDLDLIVPRREFGRVLASFEEEGTTVVEANWPYFLERIAGQVDLSTNIDLHWHFLYFESLRQAAPIRMEEVFERARTVDVQGVNVATTDPADTLIHLAMHACLSGGGRLVWMKDLEQAVRNDPPPWDEVTRRATAWRVNLFVGQMLLRSRGLLDTPVPDEVIRELVPTSAWRVTVKALDQAFPITAWTRRETPATLLAESMRPDVKGTLGFMASTPLRRLRARGTPQVNADARAAYLERVARGD
jgi:hypothetical protein